ncbi:MAG TPA: hypothetical protein VGS19_32160 [Streptosporangiaceae bacterium]|nr:hypothetical protein [Streptosporangiaceae bacterium]
MDEGQTRRVGRLPSAGSLPSCAMPEAEQVTDRQREPAKRVRRKPGSTGHQPKHPLDPLDDRTVLTSVLDGLRQVSDNPTPPLTRAQTA